MNRYSYCVNTFVGSKPVQLCGTIDAVSEYDVIKTLINKGDIDQKGYEFLELSLVVG